LLQPLPSASGVSFRCGRRYRGRRARFVVAGQRARESGGVRRSRSTCSAVRNRKWHGNCLWPRMRNVLKS